MDVERRIPRRLTSGLDRYTSLAASAGSRRLVITRVNPKRTLWRLPITSSPAGIADATRVSLTTRTGFFPRLGPDYLLYVSATGSGESIWKLADGASSELWSGRGARILSGPAISPNGGFIAFAVEAQGKTLLQVMRSDGANPRIVADSLKLQGAPAWTPDGSAITTAAEHQGVPRLFRVAMDGSPPSLFVREYASDPVGAPNGRFAVYSGPEIGTTFPIKAVSPEAAQHLLPSLTLTRGARRLTFLPGGGETLVYLRGEIHHKNLWLMNLQTGAERQLTAFSPDFGLRDFDVSPDGRHVVVERAQQHSDVVMLDLAKR